MGREVRRVPLDFDWPLKQVWQGFLLPDWLHEKPCGACDRAGYSPYARHMQNRWYGYAPFDPTETGSTRLTVTTPAVRAFAKRNIAHAPDFYGRGEVAIVREARRLAAMWNGQWCHHLAQHDVDALIAANRLYDLTHTFVPGEGWRPIEPAPAVTAEQVNTWSLDGFGHDSINCGVVVDAACERAGIDRLCRHCDGHGTLEKYAGQRAAAEAWEPTAPPVGDGWQLWETVSEGSPISPVCASAADLAGWMSHPDRGDAWLPTEVAARFVDAGSAPSFVSGPGIGVVSGAEFVGHHVPEN